MAVAAPILCAGLTVWRGLKQTGAKEGQWIAIPGAGGGLGSLAVQYAVYRGLKVIAIDSGADKKKMLEEMGAAVFIDFNETKDLVESVRAATPSGRGPSAALIISPRMDAYELAMEYIRPAGTVCGIGLLNGELRINVLSKVLQAKRFVTSYVGSRKDAVEALQLVARAAMCGNPLSSSRWTTSRTSTTACTPARSWAGWFLIVSWAWPGLTSVWK
jgi:propanol-preferring alcohol dehydrogenase